MEIRDKIVYYLLIIFTIVVVVFGLTNEFSDKKSNKNNKLFSIKEVILFASNSKYTYNLSELESGENQDILFITDSDGSGRTEYGLAISDKLNNDNSIRAIVLTKNKHLIFIDDHIFDNGFYKFNLSLYNDDIDFINIIASNNPIYLLK